MKRCAVSAWAKRNWPVGSTAICLRWTGCSTSCTAPGSTNSKRHLAQIPGNPLEALKGDRKGWLSIRINDQYRVCFVWRGQDACDMEIVDYH
jgi:hypothetical protein